MAEVSGTLIGLFLVGVFFYVETGFRRLDRARAAFEPYIRAGTRITLIVFAIPLGLSLSLVALELAWSRALFAILSLMLLVSNVDTIVRIGETTRVMRSWGLLVNEIVTTLLLRDADRPAVDPRGLASGAPGPDVGHPAGVRRRLPQHLRDRAVRVRHGPVRGRAGSGSRRAGRLGW
jgi:hypothetical protein